MIKWLEEERKNDKIIETATYIIDNDATIRSTSDNLLIPTTTIHRYLHKYLKHLDIELYDQVKVILKRHKKESINRMNKAKKCRR